MFIRTEFAFIGDHAWMVQKCLGGFMFVSEVSNFFKVFPALSAKLRKLHRFVLKALRVFVEIEGGAG